MAKKKEIYHVKPLTENKRNIIQALINTALKQQMISRKRLKTFWAVRSSL